MCIYKHMYMYMYVYIYIYIYIYTCPFVCEPLLCDPAAETPILPLIRCCQKLMYLRVFFSRGMFSFTDAGMNKLPERLLVTSRT